MSRITTMSNSVLDTILAMLSDRGRLDLKGGELDTSIKLLDTGMTDSKGLLDIILEVEKRCGVEFNPELIDMDTGLTLESLINAFERVDA
jgi:acyl carrier protein